MIHIILLYALLDLTYYTEEFLHILFERIQASANIKTYDIESNGSIERSKHDVVMSIEQSFLSGSKIYIKNCNTLDSLLYPLAQWKATS
ncbi:unnamed protein product [Adineta steineri]|uniref:Uncharacterized protein n=1 Tax=Adineta steineri TaxID=433720 RepID=A0A813TQM6_9BILA|nr:unnamed protein product [Adineta steineri]